MWNIANLRFTQLTVLELWGVRIDLSLGIRNNQMFEIHDNGVNNTNYCVVVMKCLALSTMLILVNWTELNWTDPDSPNTGKYFVGQTCKNF